MEKHSGKRSNEIEIFDPELTASLKIGMLDMSSAAPWCPDPEKAMACYKGETEQAEILGFITMELTKLAEWIGGNTVTPSTIIEMAKLIRDGDGFALSLEDIKRFCVTVKKGFVDVPGKGRMIYDRSYRSFNGELLFSWLAMYRDSKIDFYSNQSIDDKADWEQKNSAVMQGFAATDPNGPDESDLKAVQKSYNDLQKNPWVKTGLNRRNPLNLSPEEALKIDEARKMKKQFNEIADAWPFLSGEEKVKIRDEAQKIPGLKEFLNGLG